MQFHPFLAGAQPAWSLPHLRRGGACVSTWQLQVYNLQPVQVGVPR